MALEYEIKKTLLSLDNINELTNDWVLELNLISWGGRKAKYDLRRWSSDHSKMSKGITLSEEELTLLLQNSKNILKELGMEDIGEIQEISQDELPFN